MSKFAETEDARCFVSQAASLETSPEIMEAIVSLVRNIDEARRVWEEGGMEGVASATDIWEIVTGNGRLEASEFTWGAYGDEWDMLLEI